MKNESIKRMVMAVSLAGCLAVTLSACFPLVAGGVAGGALVVTDRRTSGAQLEDEGIELRAASRIRNNAIDQRVHVNLTSYNRRVLITGEVPNEQDKQQVEQIVSRVENVNSVVNELAIMGNSTLAQRSSDVLITGRVKAAILDARDLQLNAFKVVTERGTTYLMGRVTQREADRATELVRATPGVQKVVRIFELVTEQDLSRMAPAAVPSN